MVQDDDQLAKMIAIVAMGQAAQAAYILKELVPATPAFTNDALCQEAITKLTVQDAKTEPRKGYPRWQRDGFMFEVISWIVARQTYGESALLKDPHVSATSQGLDGLMIQIDAEKSQVVATTILEDKCTEDPRKMFLENVLPAFLDRHKNMRSAELVATASALLRMAGMRDTDAARLAGEVMDPTRRCYRAAFALTTQDDSLQGRQRIFKDFDRIKEISAQQRIGASLIVTGELRRWFDELASKAVAYLASCRRDANV